MKLIFLSILFLCNFIAFCQNGEKKYTPPPVSKNYTLSDTLCRNCGEHMFFGGERHFKAFLGRNLRSHIENGDIADGYISFLLRLDTLGQLQDVSFVDKMTTCEDCNYLILDVIKSVSRWKPHCHYDIIKNQIVCKQIDLMIRIWIKDKQIYVTNPE